MMTGRAPAFAPALCRFMRTFTAVLALCLVASCANAPVRRRAVAPTPADTALLDDVERRSFHYFWDLADPHTLLVPDRWPTPSFSSIAAVGFGLAKGLLLRVHFTCGDDWACEGDAHIGHRLPIEFHHSKNDLVALLCFF